jgi:hypothetical protein
MNTPQLDAKYIELGFKLARLNDTSLILKYHDEPVFLIGSQLSVQNEMLSRFCDAYLEDNGKPHPVL